MCVYKKSTNTLKEYIFLLYYICYSLFLIYFIIQKNLFDVAGGDDEEEEEEVEEIEEQQEEE